MNLIKHLFGVVLLGVAVPTHVLAQDAEIWVTLPDNPSRASNGIYGFPASDPQAITPKKTDPELYFMKGTGYQDGVIYGMDYKQGFFTPDRYILYGVDTKTWNVTQRDVDAKFALREAACGADGQVYALFEDYTLGRFDYTTLTRTDIYRPQRSFVALGVSSVGELYGIDDDANLLRISTADGAETLIGQLGLNLSSYTRPTGEIDPVTNTFYLAAKSGWGGNYVIYAVDLTTAHAEPVGELPESFDYLGGMIIVGEPAAAGAPAKATDLQAAFEGQALSGTFAFTAPTETFDHKPLEGDLAYSVVYGTDGQFSTGGTATASERVEMPVTFAEGGEITFSVKFANGAGEGQTATLTQWIGPDAPLAPANVRLTLSAEGLATVTWTAPTACEHGGHLGALTYDVWRIESGEETPVAKGLSATTFTEQLTVTTLKEYVYAVVASNEGTPSTRATSNKVVAGDGFGVPFVEQFGEGNHLEYFTVINVYGDADRWGELTWTLHKELTYWGDGTNYEEMWVQTDGATDDWLITPPLRLEPNHAYVLKFKMKASSADTPERFEVCMGRTATAEAMTTTLLAEQTITDTDYRLYQREFSVVEPGSYCIGFHATPNQGAALFLDDIEVRTGASQAAPAKVTDLTAVADPTGALAATVSFTAPTLTIGGDVLTAITRIEVLRDEALIATLDTAAPGEALQVADSQPAIGYHVYTVTAFNDEGNGLRAETQPVYVGVDVPQPPVVTLMADHGTSVHIEWAASPATGANGYVVRPEEVSYAVYATDAAGRRAELVYEGTDRAADAAYTDTDDFDIAKWLIVARNSAGISADGAAKIATGTPLTLPYRETFAMGQLKTGIWTEQSGVRSWNPSTEDAASTDAGSLLFVPYADGDRSAYCTQRLTFAGVRQPRLTFWHKLEAGTLDVVLWQPDGKETVLLQQRSDASEAAKWHFASVEVPLLPDQPYAVLKFIGTGLAGQRMFIDDVTVADGAFADGISDIENGQLTMDNAIYDLQGRKILNYQLSIINSPRKGLYIKNGKIIIK